MQEKPWRQKCHQDLLISVQKDLVSVTAKQLEAHCNKAETGAVRKARPLPGSHSRPTPLMRATKLSSPRQNRAYRRSQASTKDHPPHPAPRPPAFSLSSSVSETKHFWSWGGHLSPGIEFSTRYHVEMINRLPLSCLLSSKLRLIGRLVHYVCNIITGRGTGHAQRQTEAESANVFRSNAGTLWLRSASGVMSC